MVVHGIRSEGKVELLGSLVTEKEKLFSMEDGRRSFTNIQNKQDASLESWKWAIECLKTLQYDSIIFSSEDHDLIGAISKPQNWPSLKFYPSNILPLLNDFQDWKAQFNSRHNIKGAMLIAESVIKEDLFQSYMARGHPSWLSNLFV